MYKLLDKRILLLKIVTCWKEVEETEHVLTLTAIDKCKEREFNNLIENDVFEWVDDEGQKVISYRYSMKIPAVKEIARQKGG